MFASRVRQFVVWCAHRQICSSSALVSDIAEFLKLKFDDGLQAAADRDYLSTIHAIHTDCDYGSSISDSKPLK